MGYRYEVSPEKMKAATGAEKLVARLVRGEWVGGPDKPFDVAVKDWLIEVKCLVDQWNSKITIHPSSLRRKKAHALKVGARTATVAVDRRHEQCRIYFRRGLGSFHLHTMSEIEPHVLRTLFQS